MCGQASSALWSLYCRHCLQGAVSSCRLGCHQYAVDDTSLFLMLASVYYRIEVVRQAKLWVHCLQRLSQTGSSLALGSYVVCPAPRRWLGARPKMKTRCGAYCGKVTPLQLQHQRTAYSVWPPMVCQKDQSYC